MRGWGHCRCGMRDQTAAGETIDRAFYSQVLKDLINVNGRLVVVY